MTRRPRDSRLRWALFGAALGLAARGGEPPDTGLKASPPHVEAPRLPAPFAERLAEVGLEAHGGAPRR